MDVKPESFKVPELHALLLGTIGPRPIAWASTVSEDGIVNLAPYSFFNVFSTNPPTFILSPALPKDVQRKHTLKNAEATGEIVINIVSFELVEQMSLSSTAYPEGVNEFIKAGLNQEPSTCVKPPRVAEAIAAYECKVKEVIALGENAGAGNLIICEMIRGYISDAIFDEAGKIDPFKADLVGRMGGDWYCRAQGEALFMLPKPNKPVGMGFDQLPEAVRNSKWLTGNELARLANQNELPSTDEVLKFRKYQEIQSCLQRFSDNSDQFKEEIHKLAKIYLKKNQTKEAWLTLLQIKNKKKR